VIRVGTLECHIPEGRPLRDFGIINIHTSDQSCREVSLTRPARAAASWIISSAMFKGSVKIIWRGSTTTSARPRSMLVRNRIEIVRKRTGVNVEGTAAEV
jgi:hypothetical protein